MKKYYFLILSIAISISCVTAKYGFAATVGNALDLDLPQRSAMLRQDIVENTLDECEQAVKIKGSFDVEFVFNKDLHVNPDLRGAEMEGQWHMIKLGMTVLNRVEPYVKIGTSNLEARWKQGTGAGQEINVDADSGFAWGGGLKINILEFWGIRLTGDAQYRTTDPDVREATVDSISARDNGAKFEVEEQQISLLISKKFEIPLKLQSIYVVPYTGVTYADSNVDVSFTNTSSPSSDYSLFDANNKKLYGFIFGLDIMPRLNSAFIYSLELRLVDEVALSLGGTMKF